MADKNVELGIKISADTAGAKSAINATTTQLEKLRQEASQKIGGIDQLQALRDGMDSLNTGVIKSTQQIEKERAAIARLEKSLQDAGVDTSNLAAEKKRLEQASIQAARHIRSLQDAFFAEHQAATQAGRSTRQAGDEMARTGQKAEGSASGVAALGRQFLGVAAAIQAAKSFLDANSSLERMTLAFGDITGSADGARKEIAFLREEANRLGIEFDAAGKSYLTLAAATKGTTLEGQATRDIWSQVVGVMSRLGATSADIEGAMTQLAQGASKGKFELEDLKSIAERIPGFFKKAAEAIGVTVEQFYEMVSAGQITADLMPKIAAGLGAVDGNVNTFSANWARLVSSMKEAFTAFNDVLPVFDLISFALGKVAQGLRVVSASLKVVKEAFAGTRGDAQAAAESWLNSAKSLFGIKTASDSAKKSMDDAGEAGAVAGDKIASGMGKAAEAVKTYAENTEQLSKDLKLFGIDENEIKKLTGQLEDELVQGFQRIASNPAARGQYVFQAFLGAVDKVSLRGNLDRLKVALYDTFRDGKISADQMAASLNAINTKAAGMWKNLTDAALAEQKRLEAGLEASAKRREQIEADFAKRRQDISTPDGKDDPTFDNLFALQARARQLSVDAGRATGQQAQKLSDEALATANKAADMVEALKKAGDLNGLQASGALKEVEAIALKSAEALKNVPITLDTAQAQQQAQATRDAMQAVFENQPLVVKVQTQGGGADVAGALRDAALQTGGRA